jgi:hypothetical protein
LQRCALGQVGKVQEIGSLLVVGIVNLLVLSPFVVLELDLELMLEMVLVVLVLQLRRRVSLQNSKKSIKEFMIGKIKDIILERNDDLHFETALGI